MNFTVSTIQSNLLTLVGFTQPLDPTFPTLSSNLTTASSGLKFNDGSIPYITLKNIRDLANNFDVYDFEEYNTAITYIIDNRIKYTYPAYASANTYSTGERVLYSGVGYEALTNILATEAPTDLSKWQALDSTFQIYDSLQAANTGNQPDLNSAYWSEIELLDTFLENRVKAAIINVLDLALTNTNRVLEQKRLYYGIGDGSQTITNDTNIAGIKLDFIKNDNVKVKINRIGMHFSGAETDLDFYVYNQNTQQATFTGSNTSDDFVWIDVSSLELTTDKAGSWFIYYNRNNLTYTAIDNQLPIPSNISNFLSLNCFSAAVGTDLKTIDSSDYIYNSSIIANLDYTVLADVTDWIVKNKAIFANAIKLQFALDTYKLFLTDENGRINSSERNINKEFIQSNVYTVDAETLKKQYDSEIETLKTSIGKAKIDNISLPNNNRLITSYSEA